MRAYLFAGDFLGYAYSSNQTGSLGTIWIVYNAPIFAVLLLGMGRKEKRDDFIGALFIFLCVSTGMWGLSYFVDALGRTTFYFSYPFIVIPQYVIMSNKRKNIALGVGNYKPWYWVSVKDLIGIGFVIYYFFRAYMMLGYLVADGIQVYTTIWG